MRPPKTLQLSVSPKRFMTRVGTHVLETITEDALIWRADYQVYLQESGLTFLARAQSLVEKPSWGLGSLSGRNI